MFWICQLGETQYSDAYPLQLKLRQARLQKKIPDLLLFTSHPPTFTLGKQDCQKDFLSPREKIFKEGIAIVQSNRGGKITYHGPGQIVGYLIADIRALRLSIPAFVEKIEEILIQTLASFELKSKRDIEYPGVWIDQKKIAALGLHFDRGVSIHGFALNVNPTLKHYEHIVPCGIEDRNVTSIEYECRGDLRTAPTRLDLENEIRKNLGRIFNQEIQEIELKELEQLL